ncbi:MAG: LemA family protein [Thermoplasmata archaeon]|nr:LemA family protein [Thermoplasmata archaeon]
MEFTKGKLLAIIVVVIILISVLGFGIWWMLTYNKMVDENEAITSNWAEVTNQYQRKFDLIPQLMNLTDTYMSWEAGTLENITAMRTEWAEALANDDMNGMMNASNQFDVASDIIINAVQENYPNLDSDTILLGLMDNIAGTENTITVARMNYNEAVQVYNAHIKKFPAVWVANSGDFEEMPYYESPNAPAAP